MKNFNYKQASRIIVIDLLYLGDLLFATPFVRNLRKNYPEAKIDMIVNSNFIDIIKNSPYLNHIYPYDKGWNLIESIKFSRSLKKNNYDLGLNIHGNWRTALLLKMINPNYSIGFGGKGRGVFLDKIIKPAENQHMVDIYLQFLKDIGLKKKDDQGQELTIDDKDRIKMKKLLKSVGISESDKVVALNTGGSWPTKRWNKSSFAKLGDRLQTEYGIKVIFPGGPGDISRIKSIVNSMKSKPIIAAGKTSLKELAALIGECDLMISGDTGPVHVAASVGTPTITIFGPSNEEMYRPYGEEHKILKTDLNCRPCGQHQCPENHHKCMEDITVDDVIERIDFL